MYERLSAFAQSGGLVLFIIAFALVLAYALWPGNRAEFRRAADAPLRDEPPAAANDAASASETDR